MQSERVLVETRHGTMHARTLGIAGVPLVLSHMSPLSGSMFTEVAPRLARTRRVILPDRIGFGHSDPPPGPLTIADYADSTLDLLDELGIENFDVVGMHTGSCEAIQLAHANPDRVRRAGIVGIPAVPPEQLDDYKEGAIPLAPEASGTHLSWYWDLWTNIVPRGETKLAHRWTVEHLASVESWRTFHAAFDYPIVERIGELTVPLLVIAARDETWEMTQRVLDSLPAHVEVLELSDVESDAMFTLTTEMLATAILDFLDRFLEPDRA